jgi:glucan phosphorylase
MAKRIIKLINSIGEIINRDPQINGTLRVAFMRDFNVKNAQRVYPAAELSEQISIAGKEASGTGNMKFSSRETEVGHAYRDLEHWSRMSILNVARMGKFSADRSIQDYCDRIWKVQPVPAQL